MVGGGQQREVLNAVVGWVVVEVVNVETVRDRAEGVLVDVAVQVAPWGCRGHVVGAVCPVLAVWVSAVAASVPKDLVGAWEHAVVSHVNIMSPLRNALKRDTPLGVGTLWWGVPARTLPSASSTATMGAAALDRQWSVTKCHP